MNPSAFCTALLIVGLALPSRSVAAPGTEVPDCLSSPVCALLMQQAREQSSTGNLAEAARLYLGAYELRANPGLLFNIARVLHRQGRTQEAAGYYRQFLKSPSADAEQKSKAQEYLSQVLPPENPPSPLAQLPAIDPRPNRPSAAQADPVANPKPVHKKWWRWTLVGVGGAAVVALAIGGSVAQWRADNPVYQLSVAR